MPFSLRRFETEPHKIYSSGWFVFCLVIIAALVIGIIHQQDLLMTQDELDKKIAILAANDAAIVANQLRIEKKIDAHIGKEK